MSDEFQANHLTHLSSLLKNKVSATRPVEFETDDLQAPEGARSFKSILSQYIDDVNTKQNVADEKIQGFVTGQTKDVHDVMEAMDEADTSFQLMMEIRNKLLKAYQDISSMQA